MSWSRADFDHADGVLQLLQRLAASPLVRKSLPNAAAIMQQYFSFKRNPGEGIGNFLVRETLGYEEFVEALLRLHEESSGVDQSRKDFGLPKNMDSGWDESKRSPLVRLVTDKERLIFKIGGAKNPSRWRSLADVLPKREFVDMIDQAPKSDELELPDLPPEPDKSTILKPTHRMKTKGALDIRPDLCPRPRSLALESPSLPEVLRDLLPQQCPHSQCHPPERSMSTKRILIFVGNSRRPASIQMMPYGFNPCRRTLSTFTQLSWTPSK